MQLHISGDPAMLHKMIVDGSIDMENLQELQYAWWCGQSLFFL